MNEIDKAAMLSAIRFAEAFFDGHITIMKFTTNWRVGFDHPWSRDDIQELSVGPTLADAIADAVLKATMKIPKHKLKEKMGEFTGVQQWT